MNTPLHILPLVSLRELATELGIDRKAVAVVVREYRIPVVTHPTRPNAKLLGPDEAEVVRRVLTPHRERRGA